MIPSRFGLSIKIQDSAPNTRPIQLRPSSDRAMLLLEYHPRGLLVTGATFEVKEHLKALEGKWDAALKAWRWDFDQKRCVLTGLKNLGYTAFGHMEQ
eukprot:s843_g6.t1